MCPEYTKKAERQGFEPWEPEGSTVFETAPFDRSGTSPFRYESLTQNRQMSTAFLLIFAIIMPINQIGDLLWSRTNHHIADQCQAGHQHELLLVATQHIV